MNKRTEEKLKSIEGMRNAMTEILAQAWERGKKYGMLEAQESSSWIPIKTEKISEAEKKELAEKYDMSPEDFDDCWRYACKMPEDNQECLITTSVWGYVTIDTFHIDEEGAMYFEDHEDEDDVLAWMPLPKPYTKEDADT